jgi:hypothetical protein
MFQTIITNVVFSNVENNIFEPLLREKLINASMRAKG